MLLEHNVFVISRDCGLAGASPWHCFHVPFTMYDSAHAAEQTSKI